MVLLVIAVDRIETPPTIETEETINMSETKSDYYMADFKTRKYNSEGVIEYTIQGDTLAHYPDNDRSEIIAPVIKLNRPDSTWDISSSTGRFDTNPDLFTLQGDVVMRTNRTDDDPITITTDQLMIATESNLVSTDASIEIVSKHWAVKATGMTSAIDEGTFTLQSAVTARYDIPRP